MSNQIGFLRISDMNPLLGQIVIGKEDKNLFNHISFLEACQKGKNGSAYLSVNEKEILAACYKRLDVLTCK
jgi:hypothetical protein